LATFASIWPSLPSNPFALRTADAHEYPVPTIDHIYLPPGASRVVVADDEGVVVVLPALLISGLVHRPGSGKRTPDAQ
jgi:hypothetical protein